MKAIRIHEHGDMDVLRIDELKIPQVQKDEVLVKIKSAALNHLDIFVRRGIPGVPLPLIPGSDGAGIIEKTGDEVRVFKVGDEVVNIPFRIPLDDPLISRDKENISENYQICGEQINGMQAEYVSIPQEFLLKKPQNINWAEAAAFPLVSLTAYHMLVRKADLSANQYVLIYGASSGVGMAGIQIAKHLGATVITTAGDEKKVKVAKDLGADVVINYKEQPIGKVVKEFCGGVDVVFEHTGEQTWKESLRSLKPGGTIVTCGATTGPHVNIDLRALFIKQQHIAGSTMGTLQDMKKVNDMVASGIIKPIISKSFHYTEIQEAHRYLEDGAGFGKVIVQF